MLTKSVKSNYVMIEKLYLVITFIFILNIMLFSKNIYAQTNEVDCIYFYLPLCENCKKVDQYLKKIENSDKIKLNIIKYNATDKNGLDVLSQYCREFNIKKETLSVPVVFISDKYFRNKEDLETGINELIQKKYIKKTPILSGISSQNTYPIDVLSLIAIGFINGLSPCSLAMSARLIQFGFYFVKYILNIVQKLISLG